MASPPGDTASSWEMGEQRQETQQDGGVHAWPESLVCHLGHVPCGDSCQAWLTPLPNIPGPSCPPATQEGPLCIPALCPRPQGIPSLSSSPHTSPWHSSLATCSVLVSHTACFTARSWDAWVPWGAAVLLCFTLWVLNY